jgi:hypothetical protein
MSTMARAAGDSSFSLSVKSELIQDYLYVNDPPPLALSDSGSLAAIGGGLLAVDNDRLVFFERDRGSQSGWKASPIAVTPPQTAVDPGIVSITGFTVNGGAGETLNVLCLFKARAGFAVGWLFRPQGGTWQPANLTSGAASLLAQVTSVDVFNAGAGVGKFVYGVTTPFMASKPNNARLFTIYLPDWDHNDTSRWEAGSQLEIWKLGYAPAARPRFSFLTTGPQGAPRNIAMAWWDTAAGSSSSNLINWMPVTFSTSGFAAGIENSSPNTYTFDSPVFRFEPDRSKPLDSGAWPALVVFADNLLAGCAFSQVGGLAIMPLLSATDTVSLVSVADGGGSRLSLFATTTSGRLKLLRHVDPSANWVDLGNTVKAIAAPADELPVLELFYAAPTGAQQAGYAVYHLSQDSSGRLWIVKKIGDIEDDMAGMLSGTIAPKPVSSVAIDLAVLTGAGVPAGPAKVRVTSDQWTNLIIDDLSYWVGPGADTSFDTDSHGTSSIRQEASSLKFPRLTFEATVHDTSLSSPGTGGVAPARVCQGDFVEPSPGAEVHFGLSRTSVANRLGGNDPDFPLQTRLTDPKKGLLPQSTSDSDLQHLTGMLNEVGNWMVRKQTGTSRPGAGSGGSWRITRTGQTFSCSPLAPGGPEGLPGSFFSDIWGDVTHLARNALSDVSDWTVTVTEDSLQVAVTIGDEIKNIAATTIAEAGDLVETIFCSISALVDEVVDFVKEVVAFLEMLFEWGDIRRTHAVLRHLVNWAFEYGINLDEKAKAFVDDRLGEAEDKVTDAFNLARATFTSIDTSNKVVAANLGAQKPPLLSGHKYRAHLHHHSSRCHYVFHRSKGRMASSQLTQGGGAVSGSFATSANNWNSAQNNANAATFLTGFQNKYHITGLFDAAIIDLIDLAEALVIGCIKGARDVVDALLGLIKEALSGLKDLLNNEIKIPLITWIYETFIAPGSTFSILDVACLIIAVPVTIIYKIIRGKAPFEGQEQIVKEVFASGGRLILGPLREESRPGALAPGATVDPLYETLGIVSGVLNLFGSAFCAIVDYRTIESLAAGTIGTPPSFPDKVLNFMNYFLGSTAALSAMPLQTWVDWDDTGGSTKASVWQSALFAGTLLAPVADTYFFFSGRTLLKQEPAFGAVVEGLVGCLVLALAGAYITEAASASPRQGNAWDYCNAVFSNCARPFRLSMPGATDQFENEPEGPVTVAGIEVLVVGGDAVGMFGGTATQIGAATNG